MLILLDAMGGDNAPEQIVLGCINAIKENEGFDILLLGDSEKINRILVENSATNPRIRVQHTTEVITGDDVPTKAIKQKKDSSMVVGFNLLKEKKGAVFISAGNSGALMAGALFILGRIEGVDRPALPAILPSRKGKVVLMDAGLNSVCKPVNFLQFGIMGSIYVKCLMGIETPKVGLINMGTEVKKGNETIRQAYDLLSESNVNFVGNIEGKDVMDGEIHVAVCDGFVGNVLLKFLEGTAGFFMSVLKEMFTRNLGTKLAAVVMKKELKGFKKMVDPDENGGAPILGVNGLAIKSHGSSNAKTIKNVIVKAYNLAKTPIIEKITEEFKNMEVEDIEFTS